MTEFSRKYVSHNFFTLSLLYHLLNNIILQPFPKTNMEITTEINKLDLNQVHDENEANKFEAGQDGIVEERRLAQITTRKKVIEDVLKKQSADDVYWNLAAELIDYQDRISALEAIVKSLQTEMEGIKLVKYRLDNLTIAYEKLEEKLKVAEGKIKGIKDILEC